MATASVPQRSPDSKENLTTYCQEICWLSGVADFKGFLGNPNDDSSLVLWTSHESGSSLALSIRQFCLSSLIQHTLESDAQFANEPGQLNYITHRLGREYRV